MRELAPSLLAANFYNLKDDIELLNKSQVKYLHIDIMDGSYVPNISFGTDIIKQIRENTDLIFDVHLMVNKPENQILNLKDAGANIVSFHPETTDHPNRVVSEIKKNGMKAGIVLNTHTHESVLEYLIQDIDLILIMTVVPGFGGQQFMPSMLEKIKRVRKMIDDSGRDIILEVDGGIKIDNVDQVIEAGADLYVSGSGVFNADGITNNIDSFYEVFDK